MEDRWRGNGQYDLSIMHTCRYNCAKPIDKKKLIYEELIKDSAKDSLDVPIMNYIIQSFDREEVTIEQIIDYVIKNSVFEDDEDVEDDAIDDIHSIINNEINLLLSYKILERVSFHPNIILKKLI